ncbi:Imm42 family immunity protein [Serratia microhaemolytica]|uniref:Imm42 family immunity protein n=1 Tax=Serratia microhaemolytica TaxID=2675110 RepID=UPI000FDD17FE|nr:Imm42 family immunity protein [Serratia microhaemolytica]
MIYGDPYYFGVHIDVIYKNDNNPDMNLGAFNFIIDDVFFPGKGANYTLKMVTNHLVGNLDELRSIKEQSVDRVNEPSFPLMLAHSFRQWLSSDVEHCFSENNEVVGVDLTPLEFSDLGYYIFYVLTSESEYVFSTRDSGKTFNKKVLPKGYVVGVLELLKGYTF